MYRIVVVSIISLLVAACQPIKIGSAPTPSVAPSPVLPTIAIPPAQSTVDFTKPTPWPEKEGIEIYAQGRIYLNPTQEPQDSCKGGYYLLEDGTARTIQLLDPQWHLFSPLQTQNGFPHVLITGRSVSCPSDQTIFILEVTDVVKVIIDGGTITPLATADPRQAGRGCSGRLEWGEKITLTDKSGQHELADIFGVLSRLRSELEPTLKEIGRNWVYATVQDSQRNACIPSRGVYPVLRVFALDPRLSEVFAYSPERTDVSNTAGGDAKRQEGNFWTLSASEGGTTRIDTVLDPCNLLNDGDYVGVSGRFNKAGILEVNSVEELFTVNSTPRTCSSR